MIHYHGLPITPSSAAIKAISSGHAFVSFAHPEQLTLASEICQSFAVDNGAFSAWKSGRPITKWNEYYAWIERIQRIPAFDFAVIPDVIDGSEDENEALVAEWPHGHMGAPVWHLHESLQRLHGLCASHARVCLGSSGQYRKIGTNRWWNRMSEAMDACCDADGMPTTKIHGLRMMDPKVFSVFPFTSADSTNIARNIGIDCHWRGTYTPISKETRAQIMRERIESQQSTPKWNRTAIQTEF